MRLEEAAREFEPYLRDLENQARTQNKKLESSRIADTVIRASRRVLRAVEANPGNYKAALAHAKRTMQDLVQEYPTKV